MFVLYCSLSAVIPSGRLLTDEQIFIIVGVVVGTVALIVTLLSIIFVILAIRDRKNNGSRRKRKYCRFYVYSQMIYIFNFDTDL